MGILTKEERDAIRGYTVKYDAEAFTADTVTLVMSALSDALDTIDALEAHIDVLEEKTEQQEEILTEWQRRADRRRRALDEIDAVASDRMYRDGHVSHETVTDRILAIIKEVEG